MASNLKLLDVVLCSNCKRTSLIVHVQIFGSITHFSVCFPIVRSSPDTVQTECIGKGVSSIAARAGFVQSSYRECHSTCSQ